MPLPLSKLIRMDLVYRISGLLSKYLNQTISEEEVNELHNWAYANEENRKLFEEIASWEVVREAIGFMMGVDSEGALRAVLDRLMVKG